METPNKKSITLTLNLHFQGVKEGEQLPETAVYAFDSNGQFITTADVVASQAKLTLPAAYSNQTVRFFFGPPKKTETKPLISELVRENAYELRERVDPSQRDVQLTIYEPTWRLWLLCPCVVTGQLITTLTLPDGTVKQLPICNSRVTICEVWAIPILIWRLPEPIVYRMRDEFINIIGQPFPPGPPPPEIKPVAGQAQLALSTSPAVAAAVPRMRPPESSSVMPASLANTPQAGSAATSFLSEIPDLQVQTKVRALALSSSSDEVRNLLVDLGPIIIPFFCYWDWLEPWLVVDCFESASTDENGKFSAVIWYPCIGPRPNLYFSAEQVQGAQWVSIYAPPVRCNTHWNYACGTNVVLNVTDTAAIPCAPAPPVNVPSGVTNWVMPLAVGGTYIWGTFPALPAPPGWVQADGLTNYGSIVDAPFGGYLGLRSGASIGIPSAALQYYRWSYRLTGTSQWTPLIGTVVKHYVKQKPLALPTFPVYTLGPNGMDLFQFKPASPPPPDPGDPPGTFTYWPTDDFLGDIYSGYFNTLGSDGQYDIKLEVFDKNGLLVNPNPGTFTFIVPSGVAPDGTITCRAADVSELESGTGGFIFQLHIDNNKCTALIDLPSIGGESANGCGFLGYGSTSDLVAISYHAQHPNNFAIFDFTMVRGTTGLPGSDVSQAEVAAASAPPYSGDGIGDFTHDFPIGSLIGDCINAAFGERLYVYAKATTGWGDRLSGYDAWYLEGFALAKS